MSKLQNEKRLFSTARSRPIAAGAARANSQRGSSLVEVAFVMPLLLLILLGVIDFGRGYYLGVEVSNAAYAGALYGSQNTGDIAGMKKAATTDAADVSGMTVTATAGCECSDGTSPHTPCPSTPPSCTVNVVNFAQVTTTATYTPLFSYPGIPKTITLNGSAKIRQ